MLILGANVIRFGKYDSGTSRGSNVSQYSANLSAYIEMCADVLMHVLHHQCVLPKRTTLGPTVCPLNTIYITFDIHPVTHSTLIN